VYARKIPTPPGARPYFIQKLPVGSLIFNRERGRSSRLEAGFTNPLVEKARSLQCVAKEYEAVLPTSHEKKKSL
jgi:hypothetical protein